MMNAVMKMQGISLNLYLLDQIFHLIFSFFWPDIQINLYLRAPPTLNKIFLSGPEQRNHELWIFERKIVFFFFFSGGYISMWNCQWNVSYNKCIKSRKHYIYSKQTWLIGWYIGIYFPSYDEADVKLSVQDWLKNYRAVVFQER